MAWLALGGAALLLLLLLLRGFAGASVSQVRTGLAWGLGLLGLVLAGLLLATGRGGQAIGPLVLFGARAVALVAGPPARRPLRGGQAKGQTRGWRPTRWRPRPC